jgi:hypothetical protein
MGVQNPATSAGHDRFHPKTKSVVEEMQYVVQVLEFVHERQESSTKASASTPHVQEAFRLLLGAFEHRGASHQNDSDLHSIAHAGTVREFRSLVQRVLAKSVQFVP